MALPIRSWDSINKVQNASDSHIVGVFDPADTNPFFQVFTPGDNRVALGMNFAKAIDQTTGQLNIWHQIANSVVWLIGDSVAADGYTAPSGANGPIVGDQCWLMQAVLWSLGAVRFGGIAATGGFTSAQVLATHVPTVLAAAPRPQFCIVFAGTNDSPLGGAASIATLKTIYATLSSAGITPVPCTLTPRNDYTGSGANQLNLMNEWIIRYARLNNWPCLDLYSSLVAAGGGWGSGLNSDAIHPNGAGAQAMGKLVSAALSPLTSPSGNPLPSSSYWPSLHNPTNCLMITDTNADGIPDGYVVDYGSFTNTITAMSASEGIGDWFNMLCGSADTAIQSASTFTLVPGHLMLLTFKIKTLNMVSGVSNFDVRVQDANKDNDICSLMGLSRDITLGTFAMEFIVPSGMSTNLALIRFRISGGTGKLSIGQYALIDLTANGLV